MLEELKSRLKRNLPWPILFAYRKLRSLPADFPVIVKFLFAKTKTPTSFWKRLGLVYQCFRISYLVDCPHMENEMLKLMSAILQLEPGVEAVIVEAGAYKGGSSAKLSLAAGLAKRQLYIFDSFEGMPVHQEKTDKNIYGGEAHFPAGSYAGNLEEVKENIRKYGRIGQCRFVKGWFEETMPKFSEAVGVAFVDVDLESSTRTCLKHLYPLLIKDGVIFSHDGHLPWVINLLKDKNFWEKEIKIRMPKIDGLGKEKFLAIKKNS